MLWVKLKNPSCLFVCLLVLDLVYVPASTEKQTVHFDQTTRINSSANSTKKNLAKNKVPADEPVVVDTTSNYNNSTLYSIEVDFTSTVVENGW